MIKAVIDTNVLVSAFWTPNRLSPTVRIADEDDPLLVTGNMKHYPPADFVVTPAEFCDILGI